MSVSGGSDVEVASSAALPPPAQRRRASSAAARELDIMASDPEQRRAGLRSFDTTLAQNDRAIARDTLSQQIDAYNEEIERSAHLVLSDAMKYTKQQYKDARLRGMDEDEASVDWDTKDDENPMTNAKGEACIAIEAPEVSRQLAGVERRGVKRMADGPGCSYGRVAAAGSAGPSAIADRPKGATSTLTRRPSLTEGSVRRLQEDVASSGSATPMSSPAGVQGQKGITRTPPMGQKTFLDEKDAIDSALQAIIEELDGSKRMGIGVLQHLEAAHQKVQDKKLTFTDLPHDFASVKEDLQRVVAACKTERSKIPDAKKEQVPALQDAYTNMLKQKTDAVTKAVALQDHLQHKLKKATSNERSMYQVRRWKKEKMSQALVKGGASAPFAKHSADILTTAAEVVGEGGPAKVALRDRTQDNPIEVQFDTTKVAVWTKDNATVDSHETALWHNIMNMFGPSFGTFLKSKMESVTAELRNHANWPGALGRMTGCWPTALDNILPFDAKDVQSRGAEMWIVGAKMDAMRMRPANVPLPGAPCLIYAAAGPLLIHAVEMKSFLDVGITVADYESHQQTPSGVECMKAGSAIMLCDGDVAYVPAGWHWLLVAMASILSDAKAGEDGDAKSKPKGRVRATAKSQIDDVSKDAYGFAAVANIFSEKLVEPLPANVRLSIRSCNQTHFASKSGRAMWTERGALFDKYFAG
ncbi:unnamed protein product [Prorocentrum cordatum]|uniref:JmjC domain-containing protein n=1 Tax=Prorocentrum cordatum TaxID=2364126 RepID=A0ABN9RJQ2_9DINO|nr:unnamed protein product [Polarella glacialis]